MEVGIVLVTAGGLLVAELQSALQRSQGVEADMGHHRRSGDGAGGYDTAFKFLHISYLPW